VALGTLTLSTLKGAYGSEFAATIAGQSAGTRLLLTSSRDGFYIVNGVLRSSRMPDGPVEIAITERQPDGTMNVTRLTLNGVLGTGTGAPTALAASATTSGTVYTYQRLLGSASTIALVAGSNSNLTLNTTSGAISATAAIGVGVSQTATVRESLAGIAVEVPITITGASATPTPSPTPTPALARFASQMANPTKRKIHLVIGDSTERGAGATATTGTGSGTGASTGANSLFANSAPSQLAALWAAFGKPARAGALMGGGAYNGNNDTTFAELTAAMPNVTAFSGWTRTSSTSTTIGGNVLLNSTTSNAMSFAPTVAADTIDLIYSTRSDGAVFTVSDSSGVLATINAVSTNPGEQIQKISRATASTDPFIITRTSGTGYIFIDAIIPYNSAALGIEILNAGWIGSKASDWIVTTNPWSPLNVIAMLGAYFEIGLITIGLGVNEQNNAVPASTFQANLSTLVDTCKGTGADVVLVKEHKANSTGSGYYLSQAMLDAIDAVQAAKSLPMAPIDLFNGLSLSATDYFDPIHLAQPGYAKKAAKFFADIKAGAGF